ncbi:MAG: 50S ribosomal protein L9 [Alphaproteobacteria bacterium]|nr:50S ribosomal protein L9 [Alphaproteobacteria bacterium]NCQ66330.1 50S ribosomal protein L9 [Alphaproteobacteria bacterium]NCT06816.1 50S ribosomal protein L9 [Alphaproteobacteria bacterium]
MEVILLQRVEKLGHMGEIVTVKPGYARNHLIPKGFADRATKDRIAHFEAMKKQFEADNIKKLDEAQSIAKKMEGLVVEFIRPAGDTGNLYGSIRRKDIAQAVSEAGFSISKSQVQIAEPVKHIGIHTVSIQLHPELSASVVVNVAMTSEEAKLQLKADKKESNSAQKEGDVAEEVSPE